MTRFTTNLAAAAVAIVLTLSSLAAVTTVPMEPQVAVATVTMLA